jgi:copper chaperone NosL
MKLSRRRFLLCTSCLATAAVVAACSPGANGEPRPPDIAYGQDVCDGCGMIISEPRFACATVLQDGRALKFDDIGDLLMHHMDHPDLQVAAAFVHDYHSEKWVRGEQAFYVMDRSIDTPMGHGIAAFAQEPQAKIFAEDRGTTVLSFDELRARVHAELHG